MHTCYIFELQGNTFIKILAKELTSGRLNFIIVVEQGGKERTIMRVRDLEKEQYHEVVYGLGMQLYYEGLLVDAKAIHPKDSKSWLNEA